jgi:hypothetical protein
MGYVKLIGALLVVMYICHLVACAWYYIGGAGAASSPRPPHVTHSAYLRLSRALGAPGPVLVLVLVSILGMTSESVRPTQYWSCRGSG